MARHPTAAAAELGDYSVLPNIRSRMLGLRMSAARQVNRARALEQRLSESGNNKGPGLCWGP